MNLPSSTVTVCPLFSRGMYLDANWLSSINKSNNPSTVPSDSAYATQRYLLSCAPVSANVIAPPTRLRPYTTGMFTVLPFLVIRTPCWRSASAPASGISGIPPNSPIKGCVIKLTTLETTLTTALTTPTTALTIPLTTFFIVFTTPLMIQYPCTSIGLL